MTNKALLIDIGNSRIKWALNDPARGVVAQGSANNDLSSNEFGQLWKDLEVPAHVVVSNVFDPAAESNLRRWCVIHWQREPWFLRSGDGTLGIINGYMEPETLGSDRIAALLGARSLCQGDVVVVDCGTAVTVDWLDREEHFRGGVIFPGLSLLNDVLTERTAKVSAGFMRLPVPESVLGTSTDSCIASGVHFGLAGAIDRFVAEIKQARSNKQGAFEVFLTGGDAERLHPFIQSQMTHEPNLVLFGLREALKRKC